MKLAAEWTRQRRKISELEDNQKLKQIRKKIDKRKERKKEGRKT